MKYSKQAVFARFHKLPRLCFEDQQLTSFSGAIVFLLLFQRLDLKARLKQCFGPAKRSAIFGPHVVVLLLIVHLLLGFRRLRDVDYYRDDPVVQRLLGLRRLSDVATLSRTLVASLAPSNVARVRQLSSTLVMHALEREQLPRVTLDFDGSVVSTRAHAEGTAVGYNPKRKGARSYYNLFCTVAQTGQFLDVLHRPGNVHDSNGAQRPRIGFSSCAAASNARPRNRCSWICFNPTNFDNDYRVLVTNKTTSADHVVLFHVGRGAQEAVFGVAKQQAGLDLVPSRRRNFQNHPEPKR
ncbi:MAG: transposase [Gemmatimonadetes bacterium]|nr:transposase [Gemmatimonadota bacterium]